MMFTLVPEETELAAELAGAAGGTAVGAGGRDEDACAGLNGGAAVGAGVAEGAHATTINTIKQVSAKVVIRENILSSQLAACNRQGVLLGGASCKSASQCCFEISVSQ